MVGGEHQTFFSAAVVSWCSDLVAAKPGSHRRESGVHEAGCERVRNRLLVVPPHSPARACGRAGLLGRIVRRRKRVGASNRESAPQLGETRGGGAEAAEAARSLATIRATPLFRSRIREVSKQDGELSKVFLVTVRGRCRSLLKNLFKHVAISQKATLTPHPRAVMLRRAAGRLQRVFQSTFFWTGGTPVPGKVNCTVRVIIV